MNVKNQVLQIPRLLGQFIEQDRAQIEKLLRQLRLGEGPIFALGDDSSGGAVVMAEYAFESLLERPVVTSPASAFAAYTLESVEPRSVVLVVSRSGEDEELIRAASLVKKRGSALWLLTAVGESRLAKMASATVPVFRDQGRVNDPAWAVAAQAGVLALAMVAARILRKPSSDVRNADVEFAGLPRLTEDALPRLQDAARSLAAELARLKRLIIAGGGFYHAVAAQTAAEFQTRQREARGCEITDPSLFRQAIETQPHGMLLLSSSRCKLRKQAGEAARLARVAGEEVYAITDANDRELVARSKLALLLPTLTEPIGAILTLATLEWVRALAEAAEA